MIGIVEDEARLRLETLEEGGDGVILRDDPPVLPLGQDAFEHRPGPPPRFIKHRPRGRRELATERVGEPAADPPREPSGVVGIGNEDIPKRAGGRGGLRLFP